MGQQEFLLLVVALIIGSIVGVIGINQFVAADLQSPLPDAPPKIIIVPPGP